MFPKVPRNIKDEIQNFALYGQRPCRFLYCVLANDLQRAAFCADDCNASRLAYIAKYVFSESGLPSNSYGSYEAVEEWISLKSIHVITPLNAEDVTPDHATESASTVSS
jgi:hypothetical protein